MPALPPEVDKEPLPDSICRPNVDTVEARLVYKARLVALMLSQDSTYGASRARLGLGSLPDLTSG